MEDIVSDLTRLSNLSEDRIVVNLRTRFNKGCYYTFLGDVLVAVNPYQKTTSKNGEKHSRYPIQNNQQTYDGNPEPHIFWTAQQSYRELLSTSTDQSILVSGESGTGKTESTKLFIEHIAYMCHGNTSNAIHDKITRVNPLLEAFGNAVTPINGNSSRFGKLVEIKFTNDGIVKNAVIHDYLLEKSRVVRQGHGERNFHIFYFLFAGVTDEQRVYYRLGNASDYKILQHDRATAFSPNKISHFKSQFDHLLDVMKSLGFADDDIRAILSVLCAILHLTNIQFLNDEESYDGGVVVSTGTALDPASNLLGIQADILSEALTSNVINVRGESVKTPKQHHQAEDGRDSVAKALYARLFGWIVAQVNQHLQPHNAKREKLSSISILDFSGFECVQKNGFDQLCINAANERLHQMFHHHIFTKEREDLLEQGISPHQFTCKDNQGLIDLLFQKPQGVFHLLDEESSLPQSSGRTLVSKLNGMCSHNLHYLPARGIPHAFSIRHYAGEVFYDANGMLERNLDSLGTSLHHLMLQSRNAMVQTLFSAEGDLTGSFSRSFTTTKTRAGLQGSSQTTTLAPKSTVSKYFRKSLTDLTTKLHDSKPWFIRCVKPNSKSKPGLFHNDVVLTQLRYNGLLEIARIRRHGFPDRMSFGEFVGRYRDIAFDKQDRLSESLQEANTIATKCNLRDFAIGTSKVFLRMGHKEMLERQLCRRREEIVAEEKRRQRLNRQHQEDEIHHQAGPSDNSQAAGNPHFLQELRQRTNEKQVLMEDNVSGTSTVHRKVQDWMDVNETPGKDTEAPWVGGRGEAGTEEGSVMTDDPDDQLLDRNLWDRFLVVPRDNQDNNINFLRAMKGFKVICYVLILVIVLGCCTATKLSILTLATGKTKNANAEDSDPKMTMLLMTICFPYVTSLITYCSKSLFGGAGWPSYKMTLAILTVELGHTAGLCLLVFRVLPNLDMMRALIAMTSVYLGPSLIKCIFTIKKSHSTRWRKCLRVMIGFFCVGIQALSIVCCSYVRFSMTPLEHHVVRRTGGVDDDVSVVQRLGSEEFTFDWQIPVALVLISFVFWENFVETDVTICGWTLQFNSWKKVLHSMRQHLYIIVSLWKITWSVLFAVLMVDNFDFTLTFERSGSSSHLDDSSWHFLHYAPLYIVLVGSIICSYFAGLACKLNMQAVSFGLPLTLVLPTSFLVVFFRCRHSFLHVPDSPYAWVCPEDSSDILPYHWALMAAAWLSQVVLCTHIWQSKAERMAKIDKLFVTPMRCSILTGENLMLRRRTANNEKILEKGLDEYPTSHEDSDYIVPQIYACATMWHETRQEMTKLLKSIFRMDIDHSARSIAQKYYKIKDPDYYEFEAHVLFDDAFDAIGDEAIKPNAFVARFIECLDEAISSVHERPTSMGPPERTSVPYGGRLTWTLPGGTKLVVHLKDKAKIRNRKRWSQVMYLYYLLGFNLLVHDESDRDTDQMDGSDVGDGIKADPNKMRLTSAELRHRRKSAFFSRSVIFDYVAEDVKSKADNTYLLTLDGDVDFKPEAVHLLVDRMKKNKKVGAACGRIHPVGSGPIIWYQQFEYAIGHWLQKAMEHVFGCVLCAPGCFSLFRGSALMDDNVVRLYATRSTEAGHYVQFDQGEDRWLSTLLLQQGYRIDYCAAADAMTQAPETFNEFFNQRRRWGPSTLANVFDLLGSWKSTVRINDNISTLYMFYQALMMSSSLLGPATVLLMMAGAYQVVFKVTVLESYVMSIGPAAFFFAVCMYAKISIQLTVGAVLSAVYAIVMTVVLVGTFGTAISGSITSPNVIFMVLLGGVFVISGFLHPRELGCLVPGVLYFICIPAGYLVLTIYFLSNLHVVSWGTREIAAPTLGADGEGKDGQGKEGGKNKKGSKSDGKRQGFLEWLGIRNIMSEFFVMMKQLFDYRKDPANAKQQVKVKSKGKAGGHRKASAPSSGTDDLLRQLVEEMRISRGVGSSDYNNTLYAQPKDDEYGNNDNDGEDNGDGQSSSSEDNDGVADENRLLTVCVDGPVSCSESTSRVTEDRPVWINHESMGHGPVGKLGERERAFWVQLMAKYLHPIVDEPHNKERIRKDLLFLRNNVVFGFCMTSAVWIALFMQLEILQNELKSHLFIHIPSIDGQGTLSFQPLGLIFLGCFSIILLLQFLGMFAHRWGTMLHTLSITDVGLGSRVKEQEKVKDIIMRVSNLQKLKHIDLEPEPDYGDPLPDIPDPDFDESVHEDQETGSSAYGRDNANFASSNAEIHQEGFYLQQRTASNTNDGNVTFSQRGGMKRYSGFHSNNPIQRGHVTSGYNDYGSQFYQPPREILSHPGGGGGGGGSMDAPPSYRTQAAAVTARGERSMAATAGSVSRRDHQWGVLGYNNSNNNQGNSMAFALEGAFEKRFRNERRQQQDYGNQGYSGGGNNNNMYAGPRTYARPY